MKRYRIKTEEEFIKEFGKDWRAEIYWNTDGDMDYLCGKPISLAQYKTLLKNKTLLLPRRVGTKYNKWIITITNIIVEEVQPKHLKSTPKKFINSFGVTSKSTVLLETFANEALKLGWKFQDSKYVKLKDNKPLYFNGLVEDVSLKPQHFWVADTVSSSYELPKDWNIALEKLGERK